MTKRGPDNLTDELSAYLDGELSEQRAGQVRRLLAESDEARRRLEELRAVSDQLAALPRTRAPDELTAAMTRHAERRLLFDERSVGRRPRVLRPFVKSCAAAAVLAACVFVGYRTLQPPEPSGSEFVRSAPETESKTAPAAPMSIAMREVSGKRGRGRPTQDDALVVAAAPSPTAEMAQGASRLGVVTRQAGQPADELASQTDRAAEHEVALNLAEDSISAAPAARMSVMAAAREEPDTPTVNLWISTASADQHAANRDILARWTSAGAPKPGPDLARMWAYSADLPASELVARISALSAVNSREQLRIETDCGAADSEVLMAVAQALTGQPWLPPGGISDVAHTDRRGIAKAEGTFAASTEATRDATNRKPAAERISLMGDPRQAAGGPATAPGKAKPPGKGAARGGGRARSGTGKEDVSTRVTPRAAPASGSRVAGRGSGGRPLGDMPDRARHDPMRERIHRRHLEATAEPELPIIFVEPPSSQPESLPAPEPPFAAASESPASEPALPQAWPEHGSLMDRLIRLLFGDVGGAELDIAADCEDGAVDATPTDASRVRLRVMLLPPPATSAPASQPSPPAEPDPGGKQPRM